MDFLTILGILENSDLKREAVSSKSGGNVLSYVGDSGFDVTVDEDSFSDVSRLCLGNSSEGVVLFVNYLSRRNLKSFVLGDVVSFSVD